MSQSEIEGSPSPPQRPGWVAVLVGLGRIVGLVILLIGVLALRAIRRADPVLALVLVALFALAALLLAGVGWYADLLLRDSRRECPSRRLATVNLLVGLLLAIIAISGVETEYMDFTPLSNVHLGLLPRAGYGPAYSFGYGFPAAVGISLAAAGLAVLVGRRLRKAGTMALLLAGWAMMGWYGPQFVPARLIGIADLGRWNVQNLVPDASGTRVAFYLGGTANVYDLAVGKDPLRMDQTNAAFKLVLSAPDGHCLAADSDAVCKLAFSPDGHYLAAVGDAVVIWSLDSGKILWQQNLSAIDLTFLPDSRSLWVLRGTNPLEITVSGEGGPKQVPACAGTELLRLSVNEGQTVDRKPLPGKYRVLRLARGGRFLAALTDEQGKPIDEVSVFPLPQMEPAIRWTLDQRVGSVLDVSADGATVLVATRGKKSAWDPADKVEFARATAYDVKTKQPKWTFEPETPCPTSLTTLRYTPGEQAVLVEAKYASEVLLNATSGIPMELLPKAWQEGCPVVSADGITVWRLQGIRFDDHRLERWQLRTPLPPATAP